MRTYMQTMQVDINEHIPALQALQTAFLHENSKLNLSAMRTADACWHGNMLDSLASTDSIAKYTAAGATIADVGTGGGFPLLPLALLFTDRTWVGVDSVQKKIAAIGRICATSKLMNVQLIDQRVEDIGHSPAHRETYDLVTSRAVAPLRVLLELMAPLVRVNGHVMCWKSVHIEQELQESLDARSTLHCHLVETVRYTLPGDWGTRQLLIFKKTSKTASIYPRANGIPKKEPL